MECGKERTCLHIEGSTGHLRDSAGDAHAMQLLEREGFQNQNIDLPECVGYWGIAVGISDTHPSRHLLDRNSISMNS
jgi:hypothetical protein